MRVTRIAIAFAIATAAVARAELSDLPESHSDALSALEVKLGRIVGGAVPESISISPDRKRVAFFRKSRDGKKWTTIVDEIEGEAYDEVGKTNPIFSPDSKRVAYVAGKNGRKLAVIDGAAGKGYDAVGDITFSPDSKRVAYMAAEGTERFMILDGVEQSQRFDALHASGPIFSPDSKRVGYAGKHGAKWVVVIDGIEGRLYDGAGGLVFSPDSRQWAHFANHGAKSLVVLNGAQGPEYDGILRETRLAFTGPSTVEALVHRNLEITRVVLSDLRRRD